MRVERLAAPGEALAARLAEIHAAAFAEQGERGWSAAELQDLCARPSARLWAAFGTDSTADSPLAFLLCDLVLDEAEILTLASAPQARRRGAARGLLTQACVDLHEEGARLFRLEVAVDNFSALKLYQSSGFKEIALRKGYFSRNSGAIDAKILLLDLL